MRPLSCSRAYPQRGLITVKSAFMLTALLGIAACAFDIGWIAMTRTQLQAAADASALAGATELLPGLGPKPSRTTTQTTSFVGSQAVTYASLHRNGEAETTYASATRDVVLGRAYWDTQSGKYLKQVGATPYNMVQVTLLRDQDGSSNNDKPLSLLIAPIIGKTKARMSVRATAIVMPAGGVRIPATSTLNANLMPFAVRDTEWQKYLRAQTHFANVLGGNKALINSTYIDGVTGTPLYYHYVPGNGNGKKATVTLTQSYFDNYAYSSSTGRVTSGSDGILEIDIYPNTKVTSSGNTVPGNFGTIDLGSPSNGTPDLRRQIETGLGAQDLAYYPDNQISISAATPFTTGGDTGISAGIQSSLEAVVGLDRAITLFDQLTGTGNNSSYRLVEIVGTRVMASSFQGSTTNKYLYVQVNTMRLNGSTPATSPPDSSKTVYTPLILIE